MTTRTLRVILEGTSTGVVKAFSAAGEAADRAAGRVDRLGASIDKNAQAYETSGRALATFGAVTTGALVGSAAAAVKWQSDFAGVRKTVDDNAAGYAALSNELRGMSRDLPATQGEIAGVAEAAGQLGIKRDDITGFTRTMIDLGETTNLSANEAATGLARFSNIMGTSSDQASNLGSTIVELGNNYATTEAEILTMGQRLAGAGRQARLSEGEVLGLATALSSVGIEAEAGGTAFSRVLLEMGKSVDTQDEKLAVFAQTAGMSASEFATAWRDDAGTALAAFIEGLGQMEASGQSVQPVLDELGFTDIRVGDALRRSAAASDLFTDAMDTGNAAYAENTALAAEAAQRYQTVAARLEVLRNNAVDAAISLGDTFLPVLNGVALLGADALGAISDLPGPLQEIVAWGGAAAGTSSLLAGGFLLLAPRALETGRALRELGILGPRAANGLKSVTGLLMGPWGLALAAGGAALGIWMGKQAESRQRVEELTASLDEQTGAVTENTRQLVVNELESRGALEAAKELGLSLDVVRDAALGDADALAEVNAVVQAARDEVSGATGQYSNFSDSLDASSQAANTLSRAVGLSSEEVGKARESQARLTEAQREGEGAARGLEATSTRLTAQAEAYLSSQEAVNAAVQDWSPAAERAAAAGEDAAQAYASWAGEMSGFSEGFVTASGALSEVNAATQQWAQQQADSTDSADDSWQDFWDGQSVSLDDWLVQLEEMANAQADWETNMIALSGRVSQSVIDELARMGPEGAPLVAELVDASDAEIARLEAVMGDGARAGSGAFAAGMADAGPVIRATAARWGQDIADEVGAKIASGEMTAAEAVSRYDLAATIDLLADPAAYDETLNASLAVGNESFATADILGDAAQYGSELGLALGVANDSEAVADILGDNDGYLQELAIAMREANTSAATADLLGNDDPFLGVLGAAMFAADIASGTADIYANDDPARGTVDNLVWSINQRWATVNVTAAMRGGLDAGLGIGFGAMAGALVHRAAGGVDERGRYHDRQPGFYGPEYGRTNMTWSGIGGQHLMRFGEPETNWEAYISGRPQDKERNIGIAFTSLDKLGVRLQKAAAGDMIRSRLTTPAPSYSPAPAPSGAAAVDTAAIAAAAESGVRAGIAAVGSLPAVIGERAVHRAISAHQSDVRAGRRRA